MAIKFLNNVAVDTNVLFVDTINDRVGIGTTSPGEKLSVSPGDNVSAEIGKAVVGNIGLSSYAGFKHRSLSSSTSYALLQESTGKTFLNASSTQSIRFRINNSDKMTLTNAGNFGIGTTSPGQKLHVAGNIRVGNSTDTIYSNRFTAINNADVELKSNNGYDLLLNSSSGENVGIGASNPLAKLQVNGENAGGGFDALLLINKSTTAGTSTKIKFVNSTDASSTFNTNYINSVRNAGSDNDLIFGTSNSDRMTIDSSGNVGIGTTSPGAKFHAEGDGSIIRLQNNNSDANGTFIDFRDSNGTRTGLVGTTGTSDDMFLYTLGAKPIRFHTNATERMRIDSSGNVGIGTTSPGGKLDVAGNTDARVILGRAKFDNYVSDYLYLSHFDQGSATNYALNQSPAGSTSINAPTGQNVALKINNSAKLHIQGTTGNVGIGTTSPVSPLHVNSTGVTTLRVSTSSSSSEPQILLIDGANDYFSIQKVDQGITFKPQGSEAMRIASSGNVGIGTTSPAGKLEINGGTGVATSGGTLIVRQDGDTSNDGIALTSSNAISHRMFKNAGGTFLMGPSTDSDAFALDLNGNVGIGTASPLFKLDVDGDVRVSQPSKFTFANGQYLKDDGSAGLDIASISGTGSINFITNSTDKMIITSAGSVGIGTTSPSEKLEVYGGNLIVNDGTNKSRLRPTDIYMQHSGTIKAWLRADGNSYFNGGNVGIGTTSPGKTLDVNGDIRLLGTNQFLEGESPTTRLRNMTALPGGYIEPDTFNFRFDESATAYAGESHAIGGTISQTTGTAISDANLKRLFTYTAGYINLNTHKDSNNNVVIELDGISVSNSANNQWKPYVFFHSSAGNVATMTIEVKNGAGNWETVENAIDCVDFYIRDGFYQTSQGVLKGARFTFTNITGNSYLRMIGVIGKTHASYQWNVLKSGSKMFGDLDFGDTKRATFGNGEDLRILHEGNNSYIHHTGAGNLYMKADTGNIEIINYTNDSDIVLSSDDGSGGTTPYLRIDGSTTHAYFSNPGNVGIGTTSPGYKLDVNGDGRINGVTFVASGATRKISTHSNSGQLQLNGGTDASGGAYINVNGSGFSLGRMTLYSPESIYLNSNVGIGTSSPGQKLDVNGNIQLAQYGYIYFGSNSSNQLSLSNSLSGSQITQSGSGNLELQSASNDIHLKAGGLAKAVVRSSGNVGIGTTSPGRQLVVYNSSNAELELYSGATNSGFVYFRDSGDSNIGALQYDHNSNYMAFRVNDSERMRIDSSGKVGIGTTSPQTKLEVGDCESSGNIDDGNIAVKTNSNNTAIVIQESSGAEQWGLGVNSDGDFVLTDSGTERVRIDDNTGNFGIGTTAPAEKLVVSGDDDVSIRIYSTKNGTWTTGQLLGAYEFYGNDASGAGAQIKGKIDCASLNQYGAGFHMRFFTAGGGVGTSAIERMRINSSGAVTIGKTAPSSYNTQGIDLSPSGLASFTRSGNVSLLVNRTGSDGQVVSIRNDNTSVGSISVSGSTTSYNTSSDYRLKENVVDMTGAIERIQQLKPKRFNFISNTEKTVDGFIAHEVQSIIPEAVLGEKDAVDEDGNPEFQGIDQSKIVPLLVGAIKELKAEIENLKSQIN